MSEIRSPFSRRGRARFVVGLLILTLILAAVLTYEAQRAARSHRTAAASAIRDHAISSAWLFADHAQAKLDHKIITPGLLFAMAPPEGTANPARPAGAGGEKGGQPEFMLYHFSLDLESGALEVRGGEALSQAVRNWLVKALREARFEYDPEWDHAALAGAPDDRTHLVVYTIEFDEAGGARTALGFEADLASLPQTFGYAYDYPLLPPSLTGGADNSELLSATILGPAGDTLFASRPQYSSHFRGTDRLSAQHAGLQVAVALRPQTAELLIIGGLPRSRLPFLLGLLFVVAGLVAATIFLLRREVELVRLRSDFVSNVSHELRTPLAQIRMFAETLLLGRVRSQAEHRRGLEIIDQEARRLSHLVGNILLFSRAERNGTRLKLERTDLVTELREVLDGFGPLAAAKGVSLQAELPNRVEAEVDRSAFRQIALNLLDNAVRYGPDGQTIVVGLAAGDTVRFWVADQGPGVPRERRAEVWKPFSRLDRERDGATAGTGIGLSVVRELAMQHGGRVWVEDASGGGARFVVELPLNGAKAASR